MYSKTCMYGMYVCMNVFMNVCIRNDNKPPLEGRGMLGLPKPDSQVGLKFD
jgi:hypothetical protein